MAGGPPLRRLRAYYGVDVPWRLARLFLYSILTFCGFYYPFRFGVEIRLWVFEHFPDLNPQVYTFVFGIFIGACFFYCFCYTYTLGANLTTSIRTRPRVARQLVSVVQDWSNVQSVLDLGCGRGVLLGTIALRLEKERAGGRVVGYDHWPSRSDKGRFDSGTMAATLKRSALEGVGQIVTCKSGSFKKLPFNDAFFDLVFSALSLHTAGDDAGTPGWKLALKEAARVIKPKGMIVIWDVQFGDRYAEFMKSEGVWTDVRVLRGSGAFLMPTKVVIAKKQ